MPCNIPPGHGGYHFNLPEQELYTISDESKRCIFHLGSERELNEEEIALFNTKLAQYVQQRLQASENINLRNVSFHKRFNPNFFKGFNFKSGISLSNVTFLNDIDFSGCRFTNSRFDTIKFKQGVIFSNAIFDSGWFRRVHFRGADFFGCHFPSGLTVTDSTFENRTCFDNIVVDDDAYFLGVTFGPVTFLEATFKKQASFDGANFTCGVAFNGSHFMGIAIFRGHHELSNTSELASPHANHFISFSKAVFYSHCIFNNRNFNNATLFRKTVFHNAPTFTNSVFHEETTFAGSTFIDHHPDMINRYRALKRAMEKISNRYDEGLFFAIEQKCLRNDDTVGKTTKVCSWLYEKFSNYGQSIFRPLFGILVVWLTTGTIFSLLASPTINPRNNFDVGLLHSFRFSFDQIIMPFNASSNP